MEKIAIITSSKDPAGINAGKNLADNFNFEKTNELFDGNLVYRLNLENKIVSLYLINEELIYAENLDARIDADLFIFASRHSSKENKPSFAVHAIGNWNKADIGGKESTLCFSSAILIKKLFLELNKNAKETNYEITLEATHHGPFLQKPAVFVEVGSTEKEWADNVNGQILAKTIIDSLNNKIPECKIAVGLGGPHYCNNFNKIVLRTNIAISHICPKFHLQNLDSDFVKQSIEKTLEKIDFIILDWKGLGSHKQKILGILESLGVKFERADRLMK